MSCFPSGTLHISLLLCLAWHLIWSNLNGAGSPGTAACVSAENKFLMRADADMEYSPIKAIRRIVPAASGNNEAASPSNVNNSWTCCKHDCLGQLPADYAQDRISFLKSLHTEERCCFAYRELRTQYRDGWMRPHGIKVCRRAQRKLSAIKQTELYRIIDCAVKKEPYKYVAQQSIDSSQPVTAVQTQFVQEMGIVVRDLGETMPHQSVTNPNTGQAVRKRDLVLITNALYSNKKELYMDIKSRLPPLTYEYFLTLWARYFWHVKLKQWNPFAKCDTCVYLRYCILSAKSDEERESLLVEQREHREHVTYSRRRASDRAVLGAHHPGLFLAVYMDGMDSKKTEVPRMRSDAAYSKDLDSTGSTLDTRLIGMHVPGSGFYGWWTYPLFKQGGAGTCTLLLRLFNEVLAKKDNLPRVLLLMLDNTCKENKNNQVMTFLAYLVHEGVFDSVQVTFLLVGHTHCIIDQRFSVIHRELTTKDAFTLPHLVEAVQGLRLRDSSTGVEFNRQEEVQQALDYSWLKEYAWHFKGFGTTKIEGQKHTAHAILISKVAGEVVFQYKDQDVPGDWQGHYFNNTPLPVFHTPPVAPSQLKALPRTRIDLSDVKVKVDALCKFAGLTEEDATLPEPAQGSSAAAAAFRGEKLNAKAWWIELYEEQESFWQDKGNAAFAEQDITDPKLSAWLPRLPGNNSNWVQPNGTPEARAAASTARTLLEESNQGVAPLNLVYPAVKRWIGRPKVAGDLPGTLHFFNPGRDVT